MKAKAKPLDIVSVACRNAVKPFKNLGLMFLWNAHSTVYNLNEPHGLVAGHVIQGHRDMGRSVSRITDCVVKQVAEHTIEVGPVPRDWRGLGPKTSGQL